MFELCFFSKSKNQVIDGCVNQLGLYSKKSLDQLKLDYSDDVEIMHFDYAAKLIDEANRKPVTETTKEQYWYALEVLPPQNWKQISGGDYFQMSEYDSGTITTYYANYNGKYYTWTDNAWMTPAQVMELLNECN